MVSFANANSVAEVAETTAKRHAPLIRDAEFARRLESACDGNPDCPPKYHGRLEWMQEQFRIRYNQPIPMESIRKWLAGENKPRPARCQMLADILGVDVAWLQIGVSPDIGPKERKIRNAMVDGAVNVVAGFIQMDGGYPAFPEENDKQAQRDSVDLYAIIKGANYRFHVTLGEPVAGGARFHIPTRHENVVVLGLVRDGLTFKVYEIPSDLIIEAGSRTGASVALMVENIDKELNRIENFSTRI